MKLFFTSIAKSFQDAFMVFLMWRERHIKEKTFVIILALLVGILA